MNFTEIALARESCRNFDASREVEQEKLEAARKRRERIEDRAIAINLAKHEEAKKK